MVCPSVSRISSKSWGQS